MITDLKSTFTSETCIKEFTCVRHFCCYIRNYSLANIKRNVSCHFRCKVRGYNLTRWKCYNGELKRAEITERRIKYVSTFYSPNFRNKQLVFCTRATLSLFESRLEFHQGAISIQQRSVHDGKRPRMDRGVVDNFRGATYGNRAVSKLRPVAKLY